MVQHIPIRSVMPSPFPASDPTQVSLIAETPLAPPLYLGSIKVICQPNPPGHAPTGTVHRGTSSHPGYAQVCLNDLDYPAFCAFVRAHQSHFAIDITYDDQNNVISGFIFYATAPA